MTDRRPHICFLAPNAFPMLAKGVNIQFAGGAEVQQVMIARALVDRGYVVSMVCLDFGQDAECEVDGITVYRAFRPGGGVPVLRFVWPRLTSVWRCLKRADADIYYQRAGSGLTGVMAAFCQKYGRKSVFAMAGDAKFRFRRDRWLYEYGTRHVDCLLVQNTDQARRVREKIGRDCILIPNLYQPANHVATNLRKHVLWVGMIRQVKRPDIFLDIVERLPDLRFVMIGGPGIGEPRLYDAIKARSAKLQNLDFLGFVPYAEVGRHFDDAMLFVNTSDSEGFPNTFLQSWARGVPTVSFVDSGARLNGQSVGVSVRSVDEMVDAVAALVPDSSQRSRLAEASMKYVELHHTPRKILDLYDEVFRSLLRGDVSGGPQLG